MARFVNVKGFRVTVPAGASTDEVDAIQRLPSRVAKLQQLVNLGASFDDVDANILKLLWRQADDSALCVLISQPAVCGSPDALFTSLLECMGAAEGTDPIFRRWPPAPMSELYRRASQAYAETAKPSWSLYAMAFLSRVPSDAQTIPALRKFCANYGGATAFTISADVAPGWQVAAGALHSWFSMWFKTHCDVVDDIAACDSHEAGVLLRTFLLKDVHVADVDVSTAADVSSSSASSVAEAAAHPIPVGTSVVLRSHSSSTASGSAGSAAASSSSSSSSAGSASSPASTPSPYLWLRAVLSATAHHVNPHTALLRGLRVRCDLASGLEAVEQQYGIWRALQPCPRGNRADLVYWEGTARSLVRDVASERL